MSGRRMIVFFGVAWLAACAEPKYETVDRGGGQPVVEKVSDCATRMGFSGICALWSWEKSPTTKEAGTLRLKFVRANLLDDSPIPVDLEKDPVVVLWMPEMGHGSAPTTVTKVDVGSFRVTNLFFIMPGFWQIRIQVKEGEAVRDEGVIDFTL